MTVVKVLKERFYESVGHRIDESMDGWIDRLVASAHSEATDGVANSVEHAAVSELLGQDGHLLLLL